VKRHEVTVKIGATWRKKMKEGGLGGLLERKFREKGDKDIYLSDTDLIEVDGII
jgi:hypothetical protein